jgi:hypothetical protein
MPTRCCQTDKEYTDYDKVISSHYGKQQDLVGIKSGFSLSTLLLYMGYIYRVIEIFLAVVLN